MIPGVQYAVSQKSSVKLGGGLWTQDYSYYTGVIKRTIRYQTETKQTTKRHEKTTE